MLYKFAPASSEETIVFGAQRPGYDATTIFGNREVEDWIAYMKEQGIQRVCCLLEQEQLDYYKNLDLLDTYRTVFGAERVCHAPVEDFHLCSRSQLANVILPFLREAEARGEKVVVHCSGGSGRTGHVLAAWLTHARGFSVEAALDAVWKSGKRTPDEAVGCDGITMEDLRRLLTP